MGKGKFERTKPHVNVGSLGCVNHSKTVLASALAKLAAAPPPPAEQAALPYQCRCTKRDAWRCAVEQSLTLVACACGCHKHESSEPAPTADGGAVGEVVGERRDAGGYSARIEWTGGSHPGVGTKLYASPVFSDREKSALFNELNAYGFIPRWNPDGSFCSISGTHPAPTPDVARLVEAVQKVVAITSCRRRLESVRVGWLDDTLREALAPFTAAQQEARDTAITDAFDAQHGATNGQE